MKYVLGLVVLLVGIGLLSVVAWQSFANPPITGAPPYGESEEGVKKWGVPDWILSWKRPEGPPRIGLQVGHYKSDELPDELAKLRNNTGAHGGGTSEWEANMHVAKEIAVILEEYGVIVDILPATIPPAYWADAFIAIHADGSENTTVSGYKIAPPWRDLTGTADSLVDALNTSYAEVGLVEDPNITRNMRGYYAFSWWRNEHAIHPMTTAAIVETGFLSNPSDRAVLLETPNKPAAAIAEGLLTYLRDQELVP